jgi:hypothetical protein
MNIAFLILSCTQEKYKVLRFEQWKQLNDLPNNVGFFYLFGQSTSSECTIPDDQRCFKIIAPCGDYYEDIPRKMYYGFRVLYNMGFDAVIKIDENILFVDAMKIYKSILDDIQVSDYIALKDIAFANEKGTSGKINISLYHTMKTNDKRFNCMAHLIPLIPYATGSAYVISRKAIQTLQKDPFDTFLYEDSTTGFNLHCGGIYVTKSSIMHEKLIKDSTFPPFSSSLTCESVVKGSIPPIKIIPHKKVFVHIFGGLGNQLFQIATGLSYALHNNFNLQLIIDNGNQRGYYWDSFLINYKSLITSTIEDAHKYNEPCFSYKPLPDSDRNLHLNGYFQSANYFPNIRNFFKGSLQFDENYEEYIKLKYGAHIFDSTIVLVHSRQGDYRRSPEMIRFHNPVEPDYFIKAKALVEEKIHDPFYVLISDDDEYWSRTTIFEKSVVFKEDTLVTLYLMSRLKNFIMSNSTFSWWGVYLAINVKNVWAPSAWFGPAGPKEYETIFEPSWVRI